MRSLLILQRNFSEHGYFEQGEKPWMAFVEPPGLSFHWERNPWNSQTFRCSANVLEGTGKQQ